MIVELQGYPFEIIPDETNNSIQVRPSKNGKIQVFVHPQMPQKELIAYLTKNIKQIKKNINTSISLESTVDIELFDSRYAIVLDQNTRRPYIRGKAIHTHTIPKTKKQIEQLKNQLLQSQLMQLVGFWEERLDFLLDEVVMKMLPRQHFVIHRDKNQLVFSKKLVDLPLNMLHFVIAKSIFAYLQLSKEQTEAHYQHYIPDWKHLSRVFDYEQAPR